MSAVCPHTVGKACLMGIFGHNWEHQGLKYWFHWNSYKRFVYMELYRSHTVQRKGMTRTTVGATKI